MTWFFMRARHGGWAARRTRLLFTAGPPRSKGSQPWRVPRPPLVREAQAPAQMGSSGYLRPPSAAGHTLSTGLPCTRGICRPPALARPPQPTGQLAPCRPLGEGLAPGHRVFPISAPSILPTTNPSTFLLSIKLKPHSLKFTTGAVPQRVFGAWLLPDDASFYKCAPLRKGSTGNSQIQTVDMPFFTIMLPPKL